MAVAGILATALTTQAVRPRGLYVAGTDVIADPGQRYGVPIDSIQVTEAAPGNVSSMTFTIDDPGKLVTVSEGMEILFQDFTFDYPVFRGFVQAYSLRTEFGGQGRQIDVIAVGVEILLDWAITNVDLTWTLPGSVNSSGPYIQTIVNNSTGAPQLRVAFGGGLVPHSTQATPTGSTQLGGGLTGSSIPITIAAGTTIREAIRQLYTSSLGMFVRNGIDVAIAIVTVDFYYGLRVWRGDILPDDYVSFDTIQETTAAATYQVAEQTNYLVDASGEVRGVFVKGTGITALVMDGTGLPGPVVPLTDTTITTLAGAQSAGSAYLYQWQTGVRASFHQADRTNLAAKVGQHPGATVVITLPTIDLPGSNTFTVAQVDKTFNSSGRENWTVYFGGPPPSAAAAIRRLTRSTLS